MKDEDKDKSLLELLVEDGANLADAYALVSERIRARLDPRDAKIVAGWFDRLASGEPAEKVFPKKDGRPRGKTALRKPMKGGTVPADDYDVAWIVKTAIEHHKGMKMDEIYRRVAKSLGMEKGTVRNIYTRIKKEFP